ncbi:WG repeat-containing protein [Dysgonomonas sp. 521]|uniref:WG repeat-containing protein n=1 Tax=Dysgonomonas sp. 521 TaxID=2302932 RepID=UPI0013D5B1F5|nr:WG repeat-containing protein [Dysgonomonas sp. 521]NDV95185.1 WG repeat-containing protein [Dysgonomonas sp. 521]
MQKLLFFTILFLFGCASNVFSQNEEFDRLDTLSLPEARELLQEMSDQLDAVQKLSSVRFSFGSAIDTEDERYEYDPYEIKSKDSIQALYHQYFSNIRLKQIIKMPTQSLLDMDVYYSTIELEKYGTTPVLTVQKVFFKDGTSTVIEATSPQPDEEGEEDEPSNILGKYSGFELPESKPIDSIQVTAHYEFPATETKVHLDADNTKYIGNGGSIELKSIDGRNVSLIASDKLFKRIDVVQAFNKVGKALRQNGSSSFTVPSTNQLEIMEQFSTILKSLIKNIDAEKYKNTAQLKKELLRQTGKLPKPSTQDSGQMTEAKYSFQGNVVDVNLFITSSEKIRTDTTIVLKKGLYSDSKKSDWFVAQDEKNEKYGFIDASGKWVIEPAFHDINKINDYIYLNYEKPANASDKESWTYDNVYYWLDKTNKKLVRQDFDYAGEINDSLCRIQRETNGSYGILNFRTNEIVLPMRFGRIERENDLLAVREGKHTYGPSGKYGGYNIEGKEIIPLEYQSVETDGNYFYTDLGDLKDPSKDINTPQLYKRYILERKDVFDRNGKKINPEGLSIIGHFTGGQPLLVQDENENKFFIDTLGNIVIDASKYSEVEQFSNGMAMVRNTDGKYGYINTKGEETVPCQYKYAFSFQKNYAFVERVNQDNQGNYIFYFIDRENNIAKTITSRYYWRSAGGGRLNGNDASYYFGTDGKTYNADGELKED